MSQNTNTINIAIPLTYDMFFDDESKNIGDYLIGIDRRRLVELALYITNFHQLLRQFNVFLGFVCSEENRPFCETLMRKYVDGHYDGKYPAYYAVSERTGLGLLRYSFSIPQVADEAKQNDILANQNIIKAVLLINQENVECKLDDDIELDYDERLAAGLFCEQWNNYTGATEKHPELSLISQYIRGMYFFRFCEADTSFRQILGHFLESKGYETWSDYLSDMIKLSLYPLKLKQDDGCNFARITLDSSNPDYTKSLIMFKEFSLNIMEPIELSANEDCKVFRV